jgi:hypothetical protein
VAAQFAGDGQRQGSDGGHLVDDQGGSAVLGLQSGEDLAEPGLAVGQASVEGLLAGGGERGGLVFALADVQAEVDVDVAGVDHVVVPSVLFTRPCRGADRHIELVTPPPPGHALDKGR